LEQASIMRPASIGIISQHTIRNIYLERRIPCQNPLII
jgi:hypothetical protein